VNAHTNIYDAILDQKMEVDGNTTVRYWLFRALRNLFDEGEGFWGKRAVAGTHWKGELTRILVNFELLDYQNDVTWEDEVEEFSKLLRHALSVQQDEEEIYPDED